MSLTNSTSDLEIAPVAPLAVPEIAAAGACSGSQLEPGIASALECAVPV